MSDWLNRWQAYGNRMAALSTWEKLKTGERVIVSDETLDELSEHFKGQDTADAKRYFSELATMPNPKRIGVRDQYIATLTGFTVDEINARHAQIIA